MKRGRIGYLDVGGVAIVVQAGLQNNKQQQGAKSPGMLGGTSVETCLQQKNESKKWFLVTIEDKATRHNFKEHFSDIPNDSGFRKYYKLQPA